MRSTFIKTALLFLAFSFAHQTAFAQRKYLSMRQQMDHEIFAQADDLSRSSKPKKKRLRKNRVVSIYKARKQSLGEETYALAAPRKTKTATYETASTDSYLATKIEQPETPKVPTSAFGGSVSLTVGNDSNPLDSKLGPGSSFFEMAPSLTYTSENFDANFGARVKDFSTQETSDQAKESEARAGIAAKFGSFIKSTTKLDIDHSDTRETVEGTLDGHSINFNEYKLTQSLSVKPMEKLTLDANGSVLYRDFQNVSTDGVSEILGPQYFYKTYVEEQVDGRVGLELSKYVTVAARPVFTHRKYNDLPSRQTDGSKFGLAGAEDTPTTEWMTAEANLDLITTFGPVGITPTVTVGQQSDRTLGAWDNSYTGSQVNLSIDLDKKTGLKLTSSGAFKDKKFDNWTAGVKDGLLRHDTEVGSSVGAAVNVVKNVALGLNYAMVKKSSNIPDPDANFTQEIIGSTLTVSF